MHRANPTRRNLLKLCAGAALPCGVRTTAAAAPHADYRFIDATAAMPPLLAPGVDGAPALARYRTDVIGAHPVPFSLIDPLSDAHIAAYLDRSRGQAEALAQLGQTFPAYFHGLWTQFDARLPLRGSSVDVYLLPAPHEVLGGSVRFDGQRDLVILGAEVMARAPSAGVGGAVFIHHELAHLYHQQQNLQIRDASRAYFAGNGVHPAPLHQILWLEGFAAFVSEALNRAATLFDLFRSRDLARRTAELWPTLRPMLRANVDTTDASRIGELVFTGNAAGSIPGKTGYYVGYLVARHLSKTLAIESLAQLRGGELRELLLQALDADLIPPA